MCFNDVAERGGKYLVGNTRHRHLSRPYWPHCHLSRPHWPHRHLSRPHWPPLQRRGGQCLDGGSATYTTLRVLPPVGP
jgi:hypothetical protein